jgi:hypothetical protein
LRLRIGRVEMIQKRGVRKRVQTRCIVSHGVFGSRDVVFEGVVSMVPLVKGLNAQKVRSGGVGGDGPLAMPIHRGKIVRAGFGRALADVEALGGCFIVDDAPGELQVGVGDTAVGIAETDEIVGDSFWKPGAPNDRDR